MNDTSKAMLASIRKRAAEPAEATTIGQARADINLLLRLVEDQRIEFEREIKRAVERESTRARSMADVRA